MEAGTVENNSQKAHINKQTATTTAITNKKPQHIGGPNQKTITDNLIL